MTLKLVEGRYYENAEGVRGGPAVVWSAGTSHPFEVPIVNSKYGDATTLYRKDGTSLYGPALVKEVSAPGFKLEEGKTYEMRNGDFVGPMRAYVVRGDVWVSDGEGPLALDADGSPTGECQYWNENGSVYCQRKNEDGHTIVREQVLPTGDVLVSIDAETLTLRIDAAEVQPLLEAARKEFEESAANLLEQMADKDVQLEEARKLVEEERKKAEAARTTRNAYKLRAEKAAEKNTNLMKQVSNLKLIDETRKRQVVSLQEANDRLARTSQSRFEEIKRLRGELAIANERSHNAEYHLKREQEKSDALFEALDTEATRKARGDNRLRKARRMLKLEKERSEGFKTAFEKLNAANVKFGVACNYGMGTLLIGLIFAAGVVTATLF